MSVDQKALKILQSGGIIAYPTDTLWGIGCDATNELAVKELFSRKGRDFNKPLSIACPSIKMIKQYAIVSEDDEKILNQLFPGPITVLLPKKDTISNLVTAGSDKVGVRIPDYLDLITLIEVLGKPIITTSANVSGAPDIKSADEIEVEVDYIIQGECKYNQPSTLFDLEEKKILRHGAGDSIVSNFIDTIK